MPDSGTGGELSPVRIDSAEEQYAYLLAHLGGPEQWSVIDQRLAIAADGRDMEVVSVRMSSGDLTTIAFVASDDDDFLVGEVQSRMEDTTGYLESLMKTASTFSAANPPHHPGTLARFPVPSAQYQHAVAIPMPVLAVEDGRRGLYAPPRVVVIDVRSGEPVGVGEYPGFDPEQWPPERLGDWPPSATLDLGQPRLEGMIARMSACWKRVLTGWFEPGAELDVDLPADIRHSLELRAILDLPEFLPIYDKLNPGFARWLAQHRG
ncbi:MAG: hypothetical protein AVDCRST_MAG43-1919 [uncultured Thermomicrobiales bacterium]|uniref:Uncharacterized protein n=1 Tax=uncultured Thermomicrobiales bacterium TaxID=1645740 RepID=A0A6J4UWC1_9BACT|nr:MAG: hypothetical protein AVDCRST_MAG43-1919 [uncultured Thermomicrobiales bacterium]